MSKYLKIAAGFIAAVAVVAGGIYAYNSDSGLFKGMFVINDPFAPQDQMVIGGELPSIDRIEVVDGGTRDEGLNEFLPTNNDSEVQSLDEYGFGDEFNRPNEEMFDIEGIADADGYVLDEKYRNLEPEEAGPRLDLERLAPALNISQAKVATSNYNSTTGYVELICMQLEAPIGDISVDSFNFTYDLTGTKGITASEVDGHDFDKFVVRDSNGKDVSNTANLVSDKLLIQSPNLVIKNGQSGKYCLYGNLNNAEAYKKDAIANGGNGDASALALIEFNSIGASSSQSSYVNIGNKTFSQGIYFDVPLKGALHIGTMLGTSNINHNGDVIAAGTINGKRQKDVLTIKSQSNTEDVLIEKITVENDLDGDSNKATDDETAIIAGLQKVELINTDTNTILATSTFKKGNYYSGQERVIAEFQMSNPIAISKNGISNLAVRVSTTGINKYADTGTLIKLKLLKEGITAKGKASNNTLAYGDISFDMTNFVSGRQSQVGEGELYAVRRSAPVISAVNLIEALVFNQVTPVARFTIEANTDDITIGRLSASVATVNVGFSNKNGDYNLYSAPMSNGQCPANLISSQNNRSVTVSNTVNGIYFFGGYIHFEFNNPELIKKGNKNCYAITTQLADVNPNPPSVGGNYVAKFTILGDLLPVFGKAGNLDTYANHSTSTATHKSADMIWSDNADGKSPQKTDKAWFKGYGVDSVPIQLK